MKTKASYWITLVTANILVLIAILATLEFTAYLILRLNDSDQPLFFNLSEGIQLPSDTLLSWTHNPDYVEELGLPYENGCVILNSSDEVSDNSIKILITGGSTSDLTFLDHNWPIMLYKTLVRRGFQVIIYNSAVMGYSSSQERLNVEHRLLQSIDPDIVLSYSGVNEDLSVREIGNTVYFSDTDINNFILPNLVGLVYFRLHQMPEPDKYESEEALAERWLANMSRLKSACEANNSAFIGFLQPALGTGKYRMSDEEKTYFVPQYYEEFYRILKPRVTNEPHLSDLTDVLYSSHEVYLDDCHLNRVGNSLIANAIYDTIINRGLLKDTIDLTASQLSHTTY